MTTQRTDKLIFKSTDGLSISGEIFHPQGPPLATVILCHPHPLYGGNMHNNVVEGLWRFLPEDGFLTFRFNFRGVGSSEGQFEDGIGETHDVRGAVQFLGDSGYGSIPCFLVGYSFGAYVIYLLDTLPSPVKGIVMISPPVSMSTFEAKRFKACPTLIISGDRDLFCELGSIRKLVHTLKDDITLTVIPETDHFWIGKEGSLSENVRDWLVARINAGK